MGHDAAFILRHMVRKRRRKKGIASMQFGGRYRFGTDRLSVWSALNDTAVLKAVIPGCEDIVWTSATTLDLAIKVSLGPIRPRFRGELALGNVVPATSYTLSGRGRGLLGLAHGAADVTLSDTVGGTLLTFAAHGGADQGIMRLGRSLIGDSAQKVIDGFFTAIGREMGVRVVALAPPDF
jgi:carbon monoxide dehydrogenase subunit G